MDIDSVTPGLDSGMVERSYRLDGDDVVCYSARTAGAWNVVLGPELFRIKLSPEHAEMLMHDLYYGEYTGA